MAIGGFQLEVGTPDPTLSPDTGTGYFSDLGVHTTDPQTTVRQNIYIDLDNSEVSADATILSGDGTNSFHNDTTSFTSTGPHPLPAGLSLDGVVLAQTSNNHGTFDKIQVEGIGGAIIEGTNFTWTRNGSGNWQNGTYWRLDGPGDPIPNGFTHKANFVDTISSPEIVYTNSDVSLNAINFDSTASYAIGGHGTINLGTNAAEPPENPSMSVVQGDHEFQTSVSLLNDGTAIVGSESTLTFNKECKSRRPHTDQNRPGNSVDSKRLCHRWRHVEYC